MAVKTEKQKRVEQADRLCSLELTLSSTLPHFIRAAACAYITDGATTYLPHALKKLDYMREAIRRFDDGELQVFQEKAKR